MLEWEETFPDPELDRRRCRGAAPAGPYPKELVVERVRGYRLG